MTGRVLILRPQPGADETAHRARGLGLAAIVAPLFSVGPLAWEPPDPSRFDAVMLTSANAARHGGGALASFAGLPCYALGAATATAAREAGFDDISIGPSDGAALLEMMDMSGVTSAFHPCGRDTIDLGTSDVQVIDVPVYAAEAVRRLPPEAEAALRQGALVLLHSPRAGRLFAELYRADRGFVDLAALSPAVAEAAGEGWRSIAVAPQPRDQALLELASKLCQTGRT
jgi:uroporphyrinogen-III synthase